MDLWLEIAELKRTNQLAALCTVIKTSGSTPRHVGAKMLVYETGKISGSIGGGNLEKKVIQNAQEQIKKGEAKIFKHDLLHQHNLCCGGTVELFIEPLMPLKRLYIFGAGHTGQALAHLASNSGFEIYVVDDRSEYLSEISDVNINKLAVPYSQALPFLPLTDDCFVVIATYDHGFDRDILSYCLKKPHAYVGMIGSERKILLTRKMFIESGLACETDFEKIDMPIGIDINAETPYEIAVSILAKIIQVKNEKK
jgi:xanthine dehydrogenase accessory factor